MSGGASAVQMLMCQRCHEDFDPRENTELSCCFHSESWSGETAQRWKEPGDEDHGGDVHYFYSCCGKMSRTAPGCCASKHYGFGEELPVIYDTNAGQKRKEARDLKEMQSIPSPCSAAGKARLPSVSVGQ